MSDELTTLLRAAARDLDDKVEPITGDEVRRSTTALEPVTGTVGRRRPILFVAAAAAVVLAIVGAVTLFDRLDDATEIGPADTTLSTTIPTTTSAPSSTTSTSADSAAAEPVAVLPELDFEALPAQSIGIDNLDGTTGLYDLDGTFIATTASAEGTNNERRIEVGPNVGFVLPPHSGALEVPSGCTVAERVGTIRVAICNDGREIRTVDVNGEEAILAGQSTIIERAVSGRFTRVSISPDGSWVMALWSGECEAPYTILLSLDGPGFTAIGAAPGAEYWDGPTSIPIGWTSDGDMLVEFGHGLCGIGVDQPGVYRFDTTSLERELLVPFDAEPGQSVSLVTKRLPRYGNALEEAVADALDELELEGCCGEPSHGGTGVTSGAAVEGVEIAIRGDHTETMRASGMEGRQVAMPVTGEEPTFPGRLVAINIEDGSSSTDWATFTCDGYSFILRGTGTDSRLDVGRRLAEELVPRLGCTLGEPALVNDDGPDADEQPGDFSPNVLDDLESTDRYAVDRAARISGSSRAEALVGFDGDTLYIFAQPTDDALVEERPAGLTIERVPFAAGEAVISRFPGEDGVVPAVIVGCSGFALSIGWYDETEPDLDVMLLLGELLVTDLRCALEDPVFE